MTEQKKMAIPSLYSETEPVKKAGGNDFIPYQTNEFGNTGVKETVVPTRVNLLKDFYSWPFKSTQWDELTHAAHPWYRESEDGTSNADNFKKRMQSEHSDIKKEISDLLNAHYNSNVADKVMGVLSDYEYMTEDKERDEAIARDEAEGQYVANKVKDRKERRGKTEPKTASFDHECNIWGNNLADNREFYESVRKAGDGGLEDDIVNDFGNVGLEEEMENIPLYVAKKFGLLPYHNTQWSEIAQNLDPWWGANGKKRSKHDKYVDKHGSENEDIVDKYLKYRKNANKHNFFDERRLNNDMKYELSKTNETKAHNRAIEKDQRKYNEIADKLADRKERRGKKGDKISTDTNQILRVR